MACTHCGAEKGHFYDCPEGGLPIAAAPKATNQSPADEREPDFARARLIALPVTLVVMLVLSFTDLGRMLTGLFFAMWLHEFGHASTAWLTGSFAVPLPWVTMGGAERSVLFILVEFAALGFWGFRRRDHLRVVIPLVVLLIIGVLIPTSSRDALVVFGGDGGALILGTLFMLSIFLPDGARLARGGLRWGFLVIGAAAFSNVSVLWFKARRDPAEIPFGRIEGVGLSDASRLVDQHGWSELRLVNTYLALSAACIAVLVAFSLWRVVKDKRSAG